MRNETRLPPGATMQVHGEHGHGTFPILVVAACPPHEAAPRGFAAALTMPGAAALFLGFRDGEPCDGHDVDRVADFLTEHRGIAALGFTSENAAAKCLRLLKGALTQGAPAGAVVR